MDAIAVVGFAFTLPSGADDESSFWEILREGRNVMTEYPPSRGNINAFYSSSRKRNNTLYSKGAHFLDGDPRAFDAPFFSITKDEAASMDPQARKMMEVSYHALENAGMTMEKVAGSDTAVYASTMANDYEKMRGKDPDTNLPTQLLGTALSIYAGRLSWFFDFQGPCMHVDTACSSSLVGVDLACQTLRNGGSGMALVVGSTLILSPEVSVAESNMLFLSPDSQSAAFTSRANGYGRGEGVVALILKRMPDALASGDMIRAVIRGTGSNHDGRTQGVGRPNTDAQKALISRVYKDAMVDLTRTRYFEAHGTGTSVGDPTEMKAIGRIFRTKRSSDQPLYVGSVKSNIGHIEAGSGIVGLIKAILILEKGIIPPNALFDAANPEIDMEFYNLKVPETCTLWPTHGLRRISTSSFGLGGSNAHVILDDARHYLEENALVGHHRTVKYPRDLTGDHIHESAAGHYGFNRKFRLLVFTAKDANALKRTIQAHSDYYHSAVCYQPERLEQLAYTLAEKRSMFLWRSFAIANSVPIPNGSIKPNSRTNGLSEDMRLHFDTINHNINRAEDSKVGLAFIFTGQGAQYTGMGLQLLEYDVFRSTLHDVNLVFKDLGADWDVIDEIQKGVKINGPEFSQPLCTAIQIAQVELMRSWNLVPTTVIGHSSGEIAAAYTTGALDLRSACAVAYWRGKLTGSLAASTPKPGAMLSVNLSQTAAVEYLQTHGVHHAITIACINSPFNVTLSGPASYIEDLSIQIDTDGIQAFQVNTGVGYHSPQMQEVAEEYLTRLIDVNLESSRDFLNSSITMISTVTGQPIMPRLVCSGQYWVDNLVSPVKFADAVECMAKAESKSRIELNKWALRPVYDVIEIGPHAALRRPLLETLGQHTTTAKGQPRYASILHRMKPGIETSLEAIGRLFTYGYPVNLMAVNCVPVEQRKMVFLADAPKYPFDSSLSYWSESRLSRDYRLRGGGTVEGILGTRANDWNPLEPRWRKLMSVDTMPWVEDHMITGAPLLPAAGMVVIALAAVQACFELWQSGTQQAAAISGFHIKEALFLKPIILHSPVELVTRSRPLRHNHGKSSQWCQVQIFTCTSPNEGDEIIWAENFRAEIKMQYSTHTSKVDGGLESRLRMMRIREEFQAAEQNCTKHVSKHTFYASHASNGLQYGTSFKLADHLRWDTGSIAMGTVHDDIAERPIGAIVHPATLDAAFQICLLAGWANRKTQDHATVIPNSLFDGFVSTAGWGSLTKSQLKVLTNSKPRVGGRGLDCSVVILNEEGQLLCEVQKLRTSPIAKSTSSIGNAEKKMIFGLTWKPHLSFMTNEGMRLACSETEVNLNGSLDDKETVMVEFQTELERVISTVTSCVLAEIPEPVPDAYPRHLQQYYAFLRQKIPKELLANEGTNSIMNGTDLDATWKRLITLKPSWKLFISIARNLPSLIENKIDPLELMFSTGEAEMFYSDITTHMCSKLEKFFALSSHEKPAQRILEVGAGTGGMTSNILRTFQEHERTTGTMGFAEYMYTDVSSAFFEAAQARFDDPGYNTRMIFKTLDLDQDILSQGFEPNSHDIVIAGSVLHATSNPLESLKNLRKALKPGGKLVLLEITAPEKIIWSFTFGILPDWWRNEQAKRTLSPAIDEEAWDLLLRESGFSGNDLVLRDWEDPRCHNFSLIVSTAMEEVIKNGIESQTNHVAFVTTGSADQDALADILSRELNHEGQYEFRVVHLPFMTSESISGDDIVVFLLDIQCSILENLDSSAFECLRLGLLRSKRILWAENSAPADASFVFHSLSTGLLRSLRSEDVNSRIVKLSIEESEISSSHVLMMNIVQVFKASFEANCPELEYSVRQNQIYTPRLVYNKPKDDEVRAAVSPSSRTEPWFAETAVKVSAATPGNLETLQFIEDPEYGTDIGPEQIEVEAKTWGLSFRDLFLALGRLEEDDYGFECAGIVTRVGKRCTHLAPGDRVCMTATACMRQFARCEEREAFRIPATMSFEEAASIAGPALTVVYSLIDIANLHAGEKILIHSASGSTGQVAVMLAKALGAEVYCTVGNEDKKQFLIDRFGIPKDHILDSRDTSFAQGIKRLTKGYGVDVLLNSLSGDGLFASWECLAPYARFVEIGKADIISNEKLPMGGFKRNVSFSAIDFYHITRFRRDITQRTLEKVVNLMNEGKLRPPSPLHIYPVSKLEEAFRYFQSGRHIGRILVTHEREEAVSKYLKAKSTWKLDINASYLVVGGFGGLGRSILPWMVGKGARHLIVLSRSGPSSTAAATMISQLQKDGVNIYAPKCDVSSESELAEFLQTAKESWPPIRGCINAAMVLQDALFANMSHFQWQTTVQSKVNSSVYLSSLLPADLDFFVLLSSLAGIYGSVAQSNYAAGCTSQDALARQRIAKGLRAVSLDVGWMRTVGAVAESELYQRVREREADMQQIEEDEFLAILDIICDPSRSSRVEDASQVLLGPVTPAHFLEKGEDIPPILQRPLVSGFSHIRRTKDDSNLTFIGQPKPSDLFRSAKTAEERVGVVTDAFANKLARALAISPSEIDTDQPLLSFGVDSLVAVELRNWIIKEFGSEIAVFDIMGGGSVVQISELVEQQSEM